MAGGYRAAGGRPKGAKDTVPRTRRKKTVISSAARVVPLAPSTTEPTKTPLEYMLAVMNDATADDTRRDRMAIAAAPFVHRRVADAPDGKKEVMAERATKAGKSGRFATPPTPARLVVNNG